MLLIETVQPVEIILSKLESLVSNENILEKLLYQDARTHRPGIIASIVRQERMLLETEQTKLSN